MSAVITQAGFRALAAAFRHEAALCDEDADEGFCSRLAVVLDRAAETLEAKSAESQALNLVDGILVWIRQRDRAVLFSEVEEAFGPRARSTFDLIIRNGHVRAVFPEAKPGDSGRQFWEVIE